MDETEIKNEMQQSFQILEDIESKFSMLWSNYNPGLGPEQIEKLETCEMELFDEYYKHKRALLAQLQEARRRGLTSKWQEVPVLGTISSMRLPTNVLSGTFSNNDSQEFQQWEIKADEIKIDFTDPKAKIGHGAFGDVYRGRCRGVDVAVKILTKGVTEKQLAEFKHEVSILSKLRHENILMFMGVCTDGPTPKIVTQLMPGGSVYAALRNSAKPLTFKQKMLIARDTALGMYWLHKQKILHLDLKPGNLLLSANGTVKIADFGLSQRLGEVKNFGGTLNYMAPEMFDGIVSEKTDVYSFGMILWELCTEKYPWKDELSTIEDFINVVKKQGRRPPMPSEIPDRLKNLIRACWAQDPDERPPFEYIVETDLLSQIIIDYIIDDPEGRTFWRRTYGGKFEIPWGRFLADFCGFLNVRVPPNYEKLETFFALKFVLGITEKQQNVTIEKFGDILAYYGPISRNLSLLDTIYNLNVTRGFFGDLGSREEAEKILLQDHSPCFLIRLSGRHYRLSIKKKELTTLCSIR
jgi:serine/threonine protein kinase